MRFIRRAALGRCGAIGSLYDVKADSFVSGCLFTEPVKDATLTVDEVTTVKTITEDSWEAVFGALGVEHQLQVSIVAGFVDFYGPERFLFYNIRSRKCPRMSLVYKWKIGREEISLEDRKAKTDISLLEGLDEWPVLTAATHVITSIDWGNIFIISVERDQCDNSENSRVKDEMRDVLFRIRRFFDDDVSFAAKKDMSMYRFYIRTTLHVSALKQDTPLTLQDLNQAFLMVSDAARVIRGNTNDTIDTTNAVPLTFSLAPLLGVAELLAVQLKVEKLSEHLNDSVIARCVETADKLLVAKRNFEDNEFESVYKTLDDCVEENHLRDIRNIVQNCTEKESDFQGELHSHVQEIRQMEMDHSQLDSLIANLGEQEIDPDKNWEAFEMGFEKAQQVKEFTNNGFYYVGKNTNSTGIFAEAEINFVLYKTFGTQTPEDENVENFFWKLRKHHQNSGNSKFWVVDLAFEEPDVAFKLNKVEEYIEGMLISEDLYAIYKANGHGTDKCLINYSVPLKNTPKKGAIVEIMCPCTECDESLKVWFCITCQTEPLQYSKEMKIMFCKSCKVKVPIHLATFLCDARSHGLTFVPPSDRTKSHLDALEPITELNVLILGETGVGKSTWINGIRNYLQYNNLREAVDNEGPITLIPTAFAFSDEGGNIQEIKVGKDDKNEDITSVGKSCTKFPRTYSFSLDGGNTIINLIDTPGIGDTDGIDQDNINFNNILKHISTYDELHAICILLKPNNARLTIVFRFCVNELLAHLHRNAATNIVFCFTNSRGTFFRPGDTLPPLRKMIESHNLDIKLDRNRMYCFDNESFRFLAIYINGIKLGDDEFNTYSNSWDISVKETKRLFAYIKTLPPHPSADTVSVNNARETIITMAKPMGEIMQVINKSMADIGDAEQQQRIITSTTMDLESQLTFTGWDVTRVDLPYPRTVCTHESCIVRKPVGIGNEQRIIYKQQCHQHCYLSDISPEVINDARLSNCWAMSNGDCRMCSHNYTVHMHLTYDLHLIRKNFISSHVQVQINQQQSQKEKKEIFIKEQNRIIDAIKREHDQILEVSAKFGCYLKQNAIIPYNDAVGDYLGYLENEEQRKPSAIRNVELLKRLEDTRITYLKKREVIDIAISKGGDESAQYRIDSFQEIEVLQNSLFSMEHYGSSLRRMFTGGSVRLSNTVQVFTTRRVNIPTMNTIRSNRKRYGKPSYPFVARIKDFFYFY